MNVVIGIDDLGKADVVKVEAYLRESLISQGLMLEFDTVTITVTPNGTFPTVIVGGVSKGEDVEKLKETALAHVSQAIVSDAMKMKKKKGF